MNKKVEVFQIVCKIIVKNITFYLDYYLKLFSQERQQSKGTMLRITRLLRGYIGFPTSQEQECFYCLI